MAEVFFVRIPGYSITAETRPKAMKIAYGFIDMGFKPGQIQIVRYPDRTKSEVEHLDIDNALENYSKVLKRKQEINQDFRNEHTKF